MFVQHDTIFFALRIKAALRRLDIEHWTLTKIQTSLAVPLQAFRCLSRT